MKNIKKIGIFDSGIGGLSILKQIFNTDVEEIIYYADTLNVPYGEKTPEQIIIGTTKGIDVLASKGADCIIIACHTAATYVREHIQTLSTIPIIDINDMIIKHIAKTSGIERLGIMATTATVGTNIFQNLLRKESQSVQTFAQACPDLVTLLEQDQLNTALLKKRVTDYSQALLEKNIDSILLGCTHYAFIRSVLKQNLHDTVKIISADQLINSQYQFGTQKQDSNRNALVIPKVEFITTSDKEFFIKKVKRYLSF